MAISVAIVEDNPRSGAASPATSTAPRVSGAPALCVRRGSPARDSQSAAGRGADGHPAARNERRRLHRFAQEGAAGRAGDDADRYEDTDTIFNALKAGASGYLLKRSDPAKVLDALTELHRGGAPMTGEIARKVIDSFHRAKPAEHPQDELTAREEEILDCLAKGFVTKEIADKLAISSTTVRYHLKHIYDKLHVHSRVEAVIKYLG